MRRAAVVLALLLAAAPVWANKKGRTPAQKPKPRRTQIVREVPERTRDGLPNIRSEAALIVDLDDGAELYAKNPEQVRAIASVGKLFLALVLMDSEIRSRRHHPDHRGGRAAVGARGALAPAGR